MTDTADQPERLNPLAHRFQEPQPTVELAQFDVPSVGWVVHELVRRDEHTQIVWAWCKVGVDEPGYTEMSFTADDGISLADPPRGSVHLGSVLFKVWC